MHRLTTLPAIAVLSLALAACQAEAPAAAPQQAPEPVSAPSAAMQDQPATDMPPAHAPGTNVPEVVDGTVSFDGFGPATFGSDAEQVRMAWGNDLGDAAPSEPGGCYYLTPQPVGAGDYDLGFMIEGDRFSRIDVGNAGYTAPGGGKVGMRREDIEGLYAGRVEASSHKYVEGAHTLRVVDQDDAGRALVFETDASGTVTAWRIGASPQVDYVERCG